MEQIIRGYYLFSPEEAEHALSSSGVRKKVHAQVRALQKYMNCELDEKPPIIYRNSVASKILRRLPGTAAWRKWEYNHEYDDADYLYIRQVYHDASFIRYLKRIRQTNPGIKIIYEIPTYPFVTEAKASLSSLPFQLKEKNNCKKLRLFVDRIVTFYGQNEILGVPCIKLMNGYDFTQVELPHRLMPKEVQIISVAATAFWHGYDRLIEGIHQYYQNGGTEQVTYHVVGNILPELQKMVKDYDLEEHVIFHGRQSGEALRKLYEQCYLGVDVLGGHRKNYPVSSSLKSREYCAYGLPILSASPVDFMPADFPWQMLVPYDDSPIDVEKLIDFYQSVYGHTAPAEVAAGIRSYAEQRCDMRVAMKPVAEWLLQQ